MKIKYLEDYAEELVGFFPQIEEKEMRRIIRDMSEMVIKYMRQGSKIVRVETKDSLVSKSKRSSFIFTRIFGRKHLNAVKKGIRERNKLRDELYGKE